MQHTATCCNTLQHTATHCNTLHHTAAHCSTVAEESSNSMRARPTHCAMLQHAATSLQPSWGIVRLYTRTTNIPQYTATHCNTLQYHCNTAEEFSDYMRARLPASLQGFNQKIQLKERGQAFNVWFRDTLGISQSCPCNTLQHTATHCNTLQYTEHTATHCNTLQHTATHCNTQRACLVL